MYKDISSLTKQTFGQYQLPSGEALRIKRPLQKLGKGENLASSSQPNQERSCQHLRKESSFQCGSAVPGSPRWSTRCLSLGSWEYYRCAHCYNFGTGEGPIGKRQQLLWAQASKLLSLPLIVPSQLPEWEWTRLEAGSGASHLSEQQRSLGNKGTLPS